MVLDGHDPSTNFLLLEGVALFPNSKFCQWELYLGKLLRSTLSWYPEPVNCSTPTPDSLKSIVATESGMALAQPMTGDRCMDTFSLGIYGFAG